MIFIALNANPSLAQEYGQLKGFVYAALEGEPIQCAVVTVLGTPYQAFTDLNGYFAVRVPDGENVLNVGHPDFSEICSDLVSANCAVVSKKFKLSTFDETRPPVIQVSRPSRVRMAPDMELQRQLEQQLQRHAEGHRTQPPGPNLIPVPAKAKRRSSR